MLRTVEKPASTPAPRENGQSKVAYINGAPFPIHEGETILSFLRRYKGKDAVPTLCDAPNLEPFGSCRVCSVDIAMKGNGKVRTVASCHTPIAENMEILPDTPNIERLRRNIVELVLTDHPLDCNNCKSNNHCELQDVAARVGITPDSYQTRYPEGKNHFHYTTDHSHPYMTSDLSTCINCYRCVRACDEVQGQFVLSMAGRGFDSHIVKGSDQSFFDSECVSCGACSQACPTGAISDIFLPQAARATEKTRTVCTYCGVGCNLEVSTAGEEILSIRAPYDAEVNAGHTCLKGRYAFGFYNHPDRLRTPMVKKSFLAKRGNRGGTEGSHLPSLVREGSGVSLHGTEGSSLPSLVREGPGGELDDFVPITWDEAYDIMVEKFTSIKNQYGPDYIAGISSSRCTNEENYLMQKFIRAVIGTNNIDGCARVCHSPTALGLQRTFGTGAATNSVADIALTDCMMIIGANPTVAHPVTGAKMKQQAMKGKTLIIIDPRKIELVKYAQHHLQLRPGTNVAVLNMMMYYIVKEGLVDQSFITNRTTGYEDFKKALMELDIDKMEQVSGVDRELVRKAAIAYATAPNAMSFHGLGVTEHSQGTFTVMQIADLALLTGNIGRPGVGVNPLRGQNNVQGMADMGVQPHQGAGYLDVTKPEYKARYEEFYGVSLPGHVGYKIPQMYDASIAGKLKAMWVMGEDLVQTDPNTNHVKAALGNLDFLVVQEIFMTETAQMADLILPAASFLEKSGTFTNGERRIQKVQAVIEPLEGTKSDGQIVVDVMNRMGYEQLPYDPETLLEEISQIVPFFAGVTWENLGEQGKQWPVAPDGTDSKIIHVTEFKRGKGLFEFHGFNESPEITTNGKDYPYILTTNRELEQYNCGTMTRRTANVELLTEDVLWIHPTDASSHNIKDGDMVCVESPRGKVDIKAFVTEGIKPGVLSTTFHFPEIQVNDLTSSVSDTEAMCPEYKVVSVRVRKSRGRR